MFRFASSGIYSYFFLIIFLIAVLYVLRAIYSKYLLHQRFSKRIMNFYMGQIKWTSFGFRKFIFLVLGCIFAVISLMQPQFGQKKVPTTSEGIEVVFVLDVSMSMAAEDIKPNRLRLARIQLSKLFERLQGNRMGLVAFAGQVGVISPLTQDVGALNLFLDSLDFETISEQGTNIKDALAEAKDLLTRGGQASESQKASQVVVLVTDGEDHSEDSLAEVKALHKEGVRTYVIGVGTAAGGRIPIKDDFNQVSGYLHDKQGRIVMSKPDFKFLKSLAKSGHGAFYSLGFGNKMLDAMQADFAKLKTVGFESQSFDVQDEYFQYPLFVAIVFFFLSLISTPTALVPALRSLKHIEDKD